MTHGINQHLDGDQLEEYSMGTLPESQVEAFEEHLLVCETCQQRLEEADSYAASMRGAAVELRDHQWPAAVEPRRARWAWPRLVPAVASMALLVAVIGWWPGGSDMAGPPFAISLEATRGADAAWAPAGTLLLVRLDLAGLPDLGSYRLEMVDTRGAPVWRDTATARDSKIESRIPPSKAGAYFVRVYSASGELLREFGLQTRAR